MKFCISTVRFSVLINRNPCGFFPSQRGLRQGEPLSSFLFILAMEGFNNLMQTARTKGWMRGFKVKNSNANDLEITHLQYADDTLILCEASRVQMLCLRAIFNTFEAVSSLHINWNKSFIYLVNEVRDMGILARTLGGKIFVLPTTYLGMPLEAKSKSKGIWDGVVEKYEKKLTNRKSQYLSRGGRLTLINSVLDATQPT